MPLIAPIPHLYNRWPPVAWRAEASGTGVDFGSDTKLDNPGSAGKFTWAGWCSLPGAIGSSNIPVISKTDAAVTLGWWTRILGTSGTYQISQTTGGTARTYVSVDAPGLQMQNGRWVYLALVFDSTLGAGLKFVVYWAVEGGALQTSAMTVSSEGTSTNDTDAAQTLKLGTRVADSIAGMTFGPHAFWNGKLLTPADLQEWMLNPLRPVQAPTLLAFPDPAGPGYTDYSGNGLNGIRSSGSTYVAGPRWLAADQGRRFWAVAPTVAAGAYTLTATTQTYALTGTATGLTAQRLLTAAARSYALTGLDVGLTAQRRLTATSQSYALTGSTTGLVAARLLTATPQSYALTGVNVSLVYGTAGNYTLTAAAGSFALTGNVTGLLASRLLTATPQTYVLTGVDAALAAARLLTAASRSYALTGQDAGLLATRLLTATAQSYVLTGVAATLTASGAVASNPFRATWVGGALYLAIWEGGATYQAAWTGGSTYRATWRTAA